MNNELENALIRERTLRRHLEHILENLKEAEEALEYYEDEEHLNARYPDEVAREYFLKWRKDVRMF